MNFKRKFIIKGSRIKIFKWSKMELTLPSTVSIAGLLHMKCHITQLLMANSLFLKFLWPLSFGPFWSAILPTLTAISVKLYFSYYGSISHADLCVGKGEAYITEYHLWFKYVNSEWKEARAGMSSQPLLPAVLSFIFGLTAVLQCFFFFFFWWRNTFFLFAKIVFSLGKLALSVSVNKWTVHTKSYFPEKQTSKKPGKHLQHRWCFVLHSQEKTEKSNKHHSWECSKRWHHSWKQKRRVNRRRCPTVDCSGNAETLGEAQHWRNLCLSKDGLALAVSGMDGYISWQHLRKHGRAFLQLHMQASVVQTSLDEPLELGLPWLLTTQRW